MESPYLLSELGRSGHEEIRLVTAVGETPSKATKKRPVTKGSLGDSSANEVQRLSHEARQTIYRFISLRQLD